jgi:hypothetical protein
VLRSRWPDASAAPQSSPGAITTSNPRGSFGGSGRVDGNGRKMAHRPTIQSAAGLQTSTTIGKTHARSGSVNAAGRTATTTAGSAAARATQPR